MLTYAKLFEVGHPDAMEPFNTQNPDVIEEEGGHAFEANMPEIDLIAGQVLDF